MAQCHLSLRKIAWGQCFEVTKLRMGLIGQFQKVCQCIPHLLAMQKLVSSVCEGAQCNDCHAVTFAPQCGQTLSKMLSVQNGATVCRTQALGSAGFYTSTVLVEHVVRVCHLTYCLVGWRSGVQPYAMSFFCPLKGRHSSQERPSSLPSCPPHEQMHFFPGPVSRSLAQCHSLAPWWEMHYDSSPHQPRATRKA